MELILLATRNQGASCFDIEQAIGLYQGGIREKIGDNELTLLCDELTPEQVMEIKGFFGAESSELNHDHLLLLQAYNNYDSLSQTQLKNVLKALLGYRLRKEGYL